MTLTVLVPFAPAQPLLEQVPGVRTVLYTPGAAPPPEADEAEALVAPVWWDESVRELIPRLPRLRLVVTFTSGVDAWIDVLPEGVGIANARGAHGGATAEWAMGALLAVYREFPRFVQAQAEGRWDHVQADTLQDKRVLVVGAGDIAQRLRRQLVAFDAEPTLVGRTARDEVRGTDELPALVAEHDAVILAVPLTEETNRLFDAELLDRMPDGAVLVNAARGPVVDTEALLAELRRGRLRAALDVTDPEPLPPGHPLWSAPGVLVTPHVGGDVQGQDIRALKVIAEQLAAFAAGKRPPNLVTRS
ncbi:phosphoglycerate dehydrogenase [Longimycelium tulufanense]|uniref:Phosphoglycerate dehydrogenase n=1 Tax=Longimycelium tulufanense TaxID=907463 RepID=A0A8J3C9X0_9PSEU|nr:2-hydroxyacid dehydrogenase [Longimycelium tulufanense]GGM36306.1 phosphoglycerate dehydrogenase [Longimycelium tulufanense]